MKLIRREDRKFEQVVFGEVLVPESLNCYGDWMTREDVRNAAYLFAQVGYGVDVDHDQVMVDGAKVTVVESFIVRAGDPDFIEGAWVIGLKIHDAALWQRVLDGTLNGFSYEAVANITDIVLADFGNRVVSGVTEPCMFDGHTHNFTVLLDQYGTVIGGGTEETDGHAHSIAVHSVTKVSLSHTHRFQTIPDQLGAT